MYSGVPTNWWRPVYTVRSVSDAPVALATPNSLPLATAPQRLGLLGDVDDAHAPFADLLHQLVGADDRARDLERGRAAPKLGRGRDRGFQEAARVLVGAQQLLDLTPQGHIVAARPVQI